MRIGIDIDGVLVDTIAYCANAVSEYLGKEVTCRDIIYKFREIHEVEDFWLENSHKILCTAQPINGVCEHINNLLKTHELSFISARDIQVLEKSREWFKNYGLPSKNLYFTSGETKVDICKELKIELFIEDSPKNAFEMVDAGISVILINTEYNMDFKDDRVIRVKNWDEIMKEIEKM